MGKGDLLFEVSEAHEKGWAVEFRPLPAERVEVTFRRYGEVAVESVTRQGGNIADAFAEAKAAWVAETKGRK